MANYANVPILASDKAEIIRIFLDLMIERNRTGRVLVDAAPQTATRLDRQVDDISDPR